MTDLEPRRRALQASKELRETNEAFDRIRAAMVQELLDSPMQASETRERLYTGVNILDHVRAELLKVVDGGLIEEALDNFRTANG